MTIRDKELRSKSKGGADNELIHRTMSLEPMSLEHDPITRSRKTIKSHHIINRSRQAGKCYDQT